MKKCIFYFSLLLLISCNTEQKEAVIPYQKIQGQTMGTTYHITYKGLEPASTKSKIDSLLRFINLDLSTYESNSVISNFNKNRRDFSVQRDLHPHFWDNFRLSQKLSKETEGFFDPTVMPLVQYWGFGTKKKFPENIDSSKVKQLVDNVGMDGIEIIFLGNDLIYFKKLKREVKLDFSAIGKGYAVDKVADLLESQGDSTYFVEIGGEVRAKGLNATGSAWSIGVNTPDPSATAQDMISKFQIIDKAVATSGNYRNYYEFQGQRFGHTIDPQSGYPKMTNLLSATVFHESCTTADALATAFMSMGLDKALEISKKIPGIHYLFIYIDENNNLSKISSSGLIDLMKEIEIN